ncbi:hypothetical protein ABFS82_11G099600 [Erythranthe guttata]|uniref:Glabrous enhancer-binding protein-like DBD domain-containing protein n=1 Tax=Erythranthe guttata TaxID=4155 RepID=A0A022RZ51_ERYGU|nr:PREDICTED: uncharacterized protein LOC105959445 [Erythranthe guttata]EYU45807.1 hypothetical protein MIMGU_mgv1a027035mg [Erythranthe guttata]|eukprot:XP_012839005.1 PREDICTED: uncharacterized protein LOC105959445 [Erythranthe guttata]
MDSTTLIQPHPTSKLPIKRKTPDPNPPPLDGGAPPFKFHRIWTEPDEIRFLQGLLDCSSQNVAFPRDLGIFYARFSSTMPQPYTKSQLSEKLRRLRKKFRVISTRLCKGMDRSQLSLHDRALYGLSEQLWHPDYAATSPFSGARNVGGGGGRSGGGGGDGEMKRSELVGIKVDFSPNLPVVISGSDQENDVDLDLDLDLELDGESEEVQLSEVNVEFEGEEEEAVDDDSVEGIGGGGAAVNSDSGGENRIGEAAAKVVVNVFDECFKDVRKRFLLSDQGGETGGGGGGGSADTFQVRWQKQRIAELDVLGSRLRLVIEHSLQKH